MPVAPSAAYALSKPSTPEDARQEVVELAKTGHHVTHAEAKEIIAKHKSPAVEPPPPPVVDLFDVDDREAREPDDPPPPAVEVEGDPVEEAEPPDYGSMHPADRPLPPRSAAAWEKIFANHRRHLTESQRAMIGARIKPRFEEQAKERQTTSTGGSVPQLRANLPEAKEPRPRVKAAELLSVSPRSVEAATP